MKTSLFPTGKHLVEVPCNTCDATYSLSEVAHRVAQKFKNIEYHLLPMDEQLPDIAKAWDVTQVPALVLIDEGEIVGKVHGYQPDEILELYVQAKMKEEIR